MSNITLSICIPTYNRAPFLKQCLDSIVSQFHDELIKSQVDIVISDNGSTDNTTAVVQEYQEKFSNISYFRNTENLGVDKNILQVVDKASGKFVWLLGDDDALFEGSLKYLLALLIGSEYGYVMANSWGYNKELTEQAVSRPNLNIKENEFFSSLEVFVRNIGDFRNTVGFFGGLSCQIFKRSVWQALPNKEEFIGSQALHLFVILKACKNLPVCLASKPLVKTRADNIRWDTFPGLSTVAQRSQKTKQTAKWIYELYNIPYPNFYLEWYFFWNSLKSFFINGVKKYLLFSPVVRKPIIKLAKFILRK